MEVLLWSCAIHCSKWQVQLNIGDLLFHIQCAYESQQSLRCSLVLNNRNHCLELRNKNLMIPDFKALSFVLGGSLCPAKLMLVNCNINTAYAIKAMNGLLLECGSNLCELDLSGNNLQNGAMLWIY